MDRANALENIRLGQLDHAHLVALQWRMPDLTRQKITFGEIHDAGVRGLLIYCSDYKCSHGTAISGDRWPDDVRLSDIEPRFTCQACGRKGADLRPDFGWEEGARRATLSGRHTSGLNQTVGPNLRHGRIEHDGRFVAKVRVIEKSHANAAALLRYVADQ